MVMTDNYEIVGFDGLPVKGGIGRKPAVIRDPATGRYAVIAGGRPLRWVDAGTIDEAVERGLATQLASPLGSWSPGTCVAYIDIQHLATPWGGMMLEQIKMRSAPLLPYAWVWCEPVTTALERFSIWAILFLDSAKSRFIGWDTHSADEQFAAVVADVDRARFCIAAVGASARDLRRRAAVLLAAAYWRGGRVEDEALWRDLSLDFDRRELDRVKSDAIASAGDHMIPPPIWMDDPDFIRKEEPACI